MRGVYACPVEGFGGSAIAPAEGRLQGRRHSVSKRNAREREEKNKGLLDGVIVTNANALNEHEVQHDLLLLPSDSGEIRSACK